MTIAELLKNASFALGWKYFIFLDFLNARICPDYFRRQPDIYCPVNACIHIYPELSSETTWLHSSQKPPSFKWEKSKSGVREIKIWGASCAKHLALTRTSLWTLLNRFTRARVELYLLHGLLESPYSAIHSFWLVTYLIFKCYMWWWKGRRENTADSCMATGTKRWLGKFLKLKARVIIKR